MSGVRYGEISVGDIDPSLPPALTAALRGKNLLIVCGAGVSVAPPSNLPSWWDFNTALFETLRGEAAKALPDVADTLMASSLEGRMPVTAFSELVVSTFAGDGYFSLLTTLDSAMPNANHFAMAALAVQGVLTDIVSFNFDTLIEQAFRAKKIPLQVLVRPEDYDRPFSSKNGTRLHKIHGSVTDAATLIDTVTQKLKGLAVGRRDRMRSLFSQRHVLFLGFSGADFEFGADYLPMDANANGGTGFTWLYRGTSPPALSARFTDPAGTFVSGDLPSFFSYFGIRVEPAPVAASTATSTVKDRLQVWVSGVTVGQWVSASFMHAFAEKQQDEVLFSKLGAGLEKAVSDALLTGKLDLGMSSCARLR
jgi:hypothetical protein